MTISLSTIRILKIRCSDRQQLEEEVAKKKTYSTLRKVVKHSLCNGFCFQILAMAVATKNRLYYMVAGFELPQISSSSTQQPIALLPFPTLVRPPSLVQRTTPPPLGFTVAMNRVREERARESERMRSKTVNDLDRDALLTLFESNCYPTSCQPDSGPFSSDTTSNDLKLPISVFCKY